MSRNPFDVEPEELIKRFRQALRGALGEQIERASILHHSGGWFYFNLANRFPDGTCGAFGAAQGYRRNMLILKMLDYRKRARNRRARERRAGKRK